MDTRSTDALRERVAWLEVLVREPINNGDGYTIFDHLQILTNEVLQISSSEQLETSSAYVTVDKVEDLKVGF